jgi:hypothetical protein
VRNRRGLVYTSSRLTRRSSRVCKSTVGSTNILVHAHDLGRLMLGPLKGFGNAEMRQTNIHSN